MLVSYHILDYGGNLCEFRLKLVIKSTQLFEKATCSGVLEFRIFRATPLEQFSRVEFQFLVPLLPFIEGQLRHI